MVRAMDSKEKECLNPNIMYSCFLSGLCTGIALVMIIMKLMLAINIPIWSLLLPVITPEVCAFLCYGFHRGAKMAYSITIYVQVKKNTHWMHIKFRETDVQLVFIRISTSRTWSSTVGRKWRIV